MMYLFPLPLRIVAWMLTVGCRLRILIPARDRLLRRLISLDRRSRGICNTQYGVVLGMMEIVRVDENGVIYGLSWIALYSIYFVFVVIVVSCTYHSHPRCPTTSPRYLPSKTIQVSVHFILFSFLIHTLYTSRYITTDHQARYHWQSPGPTSTC